MNLPLTLQDLRDYVDQLEQLEVEMEELDEDEFSKTSMKYIRGELRRAKQKLRERERELLRWIAQA